jgi:AAA family ATP:ADP antiporter
VAQKTNDRRDIPSRAIGPGQDTRTIMISARDRSSHIGATLFLLMAAFVLAKTGRDALYFQEGGLLDLPKAYVLIAIFSIPMAFAMLGLMRMLGTRRSRVVAPLLMAGFMITYAFLARPGGGFIMTASYVVVPLAFGVLFSQAWLLTAELFEASAREEIAQAYSIVGAAAIGGGVAGGALAKLLSRFVDPQGLLFVSALALSAAAGVVAVTQARFPLPVARTTRSVRAPGSAEFRRVATERYSYMLLAIAMTASLVGILVEFQFYIAATIAGRGGRANADFFAGFYLVLNAIALAAQLWVMPRVQRRLGVHGSLLVLPAALLGLAGALLVNASIMTRSLLRVAEGGLKSSVHRVNWEQAYLPLDRHHRAAAKLFVDGMGARLAEGAAAGILFLWIRAAMPDGTMIESRIGWITWALLGTVLAWIVLTRALARSLAPVTTSAALEQGASLAVPLPDS